MCCFVYLYVVCFFFLECAHTKANNVFLYKKNTHTKKELKKKRKKNKKTTKKKKIKRMNLYFVIEAMSAINWENSVLLESSDLCMNLPNGLHDWDSVKVTIDGIICTLLCLCVC